MKKQPKPNNFGTSSSIKLLSRQEALEAIRHDYNPFDWDYVDYIINKQENAALPLESPKEAILEGEKHER